MRAASLACALVAAVLAAGVAFAAGAKPREAKDKPPVEREPMVFDATAGMPAPRIGDRGVVVDPAAVDALFLQDTEAEANGLKAHDRYQSVHFTIVPDVKDDAYFHRLQDDCERFFSQLQKEFWDFIPPEHRESHMTVMAFGSQEAFDRFAREDSGLPRGEKGYSKAAAARIVYERQSAYYRDVMIIVHEMTHIFNHFCLDSAPLWVDEGLAQYYSYYAGEEMGGGSLKSGINNDALRAIDDGLKSGAFSGVGELLAMNESEFYSEDDAARGMLNYSEAWALVYYLRRGMQDGDERFGAYYAALGRKEDPAEAFVTAYGDGEALRREWIAFLQRIHNKTAARRKALPAPARPASPK